MTDETQSMHSSQPSRDQRLEEVLAGYLRRVEAGEEIDRQAILALHPDLAEELRQFFANQARLARIVGQPAGGPNAGSTPSARPTNLRYFGDYEILEEIAAGGMGVVYKARQASLNRTVAVKMILAGQLANEGEVKRFQAEAEAAANLHHPGVVAIHEVGVQDGQHYFSMEYVQGQNLAQLLREKPLSVTQAAAYVRDMAEVVEYAHRQGVLHRDLKPSNVLIDASDRVRITDFGLAKRVTGESDLTITGQVIGTPSYMPPEQAAAQHAVIGATSDVYALGAILYELIAGRPPFRADNVGETLRQVQQDDPVRPRLLNPKLPRDLETICLKCLEKEPRRRYGSAQQLADELGRFLRGEPIHARPIGPVSRAWRWCRRKPVVATLTVATAVLLLATGVASALGLLWFGVADRLTDDLRVHEAQQLCEGPQPNYREAARLLTKVIARRPQEGELYFSRAQAWHELRDNQRALEDAQRAIELGLASAEARLLAVVSAVELGRADVARKYAADLGQHSPGSIQALIAARLTTPQPNGAPDDLLRTFDQQPPDAKLHYYRGLLVLRHMEYQPDRRSFEQATASLERVLQSRPQDVRARESLCQCYLRFYALAEANDQPLDRGKALLDDWPPEPVGAWQKDLLLARWHLQTGQAAAAEDLCRTTLKLNPGRPELNYLLGLALERQGRHEEAEIALAEAERDLERQPETLWPLTKLQVFATRAWNQPVQGDRERWLAELRQLLDAEKNQKWTNDEWQAIVAAQLSLNKREVWDWWTRWTTAMPGSPDAYYFRGLHGDDKRGSFGKALTLGPGMHEAYKQRAKLRDERGAIEDYRTYLTHVPQDAEAHLALALLLSECQGLAHRDLAAARESARQAAELAPRNQGAWLLRVRIERYLHDSEQALALADQAIAADPHSDAMRFVRAEILLDRGEAAQALDNVDRTLRSGPLTHARLHTAARILATPLAATEACAERAVELARQALASAPQEFSQQQSFQLNAELQKIRRTLAIALYRSGRYEEALSVSEPKGDNQSEFFRAMILWRVGAQNEARALYEGTARQAGMSLAALDPVQRGQTAARREAAALLGYQLVPDAPLRDKEQRSVRPGDSPQLGGWSGRNNVATSTGIPATWDPGKFDRKTGQWLAEGARNIKWVARLGTMAYGSPVAANGHVYVGTNNSAGYLKRFPPQVDLGCLLCFRESDGQFLWQYSAEKLPTGRVHDWPMIGIASAPLVEGDRLWFVSNRGEILCLDTQGHQDGQDDGIADGPLKERLFQTPCFLHDLVKQRPIPGELRKALANAGIECPENVGMTRNVAAPFRWRRDFGQGEVDWLSFQVRGDKLLVQELVAPLGIDAPRTETIDNAIWPQPGTPEMIEALREKFAAAGVTLPVKLEVRVEVPGKRWSFPLSSADEGEQCVVYQYSSNWIAERLRPLRSEDKHEADVVWRLDMMKELGVSQHNMCTCPPTAWGDTLFICTSNGVDESHVKIPAPQAPSFLALDKHTGKILWTDNSPGENVQHGQWSGPAAGILGGVPQVVFPGGDGWVYSFHAEEFADGKPKLLWKFDVNPKDAVLDNGGRGTRNEPFAVPVIYDGWVYVTTGQDPEHGEGLATIWCIDPTKRGDVSPQLVVDRQDRNRVIPHRRVKAILPEQGEIAIENPNSAVIWRYEQGRLDSFYGEFHRSISSVAIQDDLLIAVDFSGLVHCLNAKSGVIYWNYDMLAAAWSSPLIVGDRVFIGDEDGDIVILPMIPYPAVLPGSLEGDEDATPLAEIALSYSIYSTPIVVNDVLYIATKSHLFAIANSDRDLPSPKLTDKK